MAKNKDTAEQVSAQLVGQAVDQALASVAQGAPGEAPLPIEVAQTEVQSAPAGDAMLTLDPAAPNTWQQALAARGQTGFTSTDTGTDTIQQMREQIKDEAIREQDRFLGAVLWEGKTPKKDSMQLPKAVDSFLDKILS